MSVVGVRGPQRPHLEVHARRLSARARVPCAFSQTRQTGAKNPTLTLAGCPASSGMTLRPTQAILGPLCQKVGSLHGTLSPEVGAPAKTTG